MLMELVMDTCKNSQDIEQIVQILPSLQTGLDIDLKFDGAFSFETSSQLLIFKVLNIPL